MFSTKPRRLASFLHGFGNAFALFPEENMTPYTTRQSIQSRMRENYARAGILISTSMDKARDEQEKTDRQKSTEE